MYCWLGTQNSHRFCLHPRLPRVFQAQKDKIKENTEKIRVNKTLPYLVSNVIELLDVDPEELGEEDGANVDLDSQRKGECLR